MQCAPDVGLTTKVLLPCREMRMKAILVVDDDEDTLDVLVELLRDGGYLPVAATTAEGAWTLLHDRRPDLLLTDLLLPQMDGWQLLRKLRDDPDLALLPAIAMTGWAWPAPLPEGVALIAKPFEGERLLGLVQMYCGDSMVTRRPGSEMVTRKCGA
jgi:CheY-like chemotaxis protein